MQRQIRSTLACDASTACKMVERLLEKKTECMGIWWQSQWKSQVFNSAKMVMKAACRQSRHYHHRLLVTG